MSGSSSFVFSSLHPKIFHGRSSSASTIYPGVQAHPLLQAFESHLCAELSQLQERGQCLSAGWLRRALDACVSVHCRVEELFPHIQQAALHQNVKWFNDHMEDTVKLLDICNALRETMTDVRRYQASLQLAVHCLETAPTTSAGQLLRARNALGKETSKSREPSRLETCGSMLRRIGEKLVAPPPPPAGAKADFLAALHASKAVTVFVCGALVAALSLKRKRLMAAPSCATWACALNKLHSKLKDEIEQKRSKGARAPLLRELDAVDGAARGLYDLLNRLINTKSVPPNDSAAQELRHSVHSLKKCLAELEDEMVPLERQMNKLFRFLITGRMALLDILSYS